MRKILIGLLSGTFFVAAASSANAAETSPTPSTDHPISVAAFGGYGFNNSLDSNAKDSFNLYGAGFGVRAGYTLPMKLYLGGMFQYNLGSELEGTTGKTRGRVMNLGGEVGYNFDVAQFTIRPYVGAGVGIAGGDIKGLDEHDNKVKFSVWPGVQGLYNVTDQLYAGIDARYTFIFTDLGPGGGNANAIGVYGTVGYRF
ncbi:porin family protein [Pendulispora rubella]|uniref:Porin family protein n=1 Tax=Pendulispora rubella TaxID=2741070 RepID=A0ABZ2LH41_9BACT